MGKAILLLHGWLSDINDFEALIPILKKNYQHIEKLTYPGHGSEDDYNDFVADKTIDLVEEAFKRLESKYKIIDVIGFSMGGALASYFSNKYNFRKLVLLAPANKYINLIIPFSKMKYIIKNFYEMQKAFIFRKEEEVTTYKQKLKAVVEDDRQSLKFLRDRYLKSYFRHAYKNFQEVINTCNEGLTEIKNPCFIAWGELDQLVPKESVTHIYEMCTNENKQLKIYEDLSHLLILSSNNETICQDIEKFLED